MHHLHPTYTFQVGDTTFTVTQGDVLEAQAEALLCYSSTSLTLHSNLAQRMVAQGGPLIRAEGAKHAPARCGSALMLPAGKLASRYLIVAVTNTLRDAPTLDSLRSCMCAVAAQADHHRLRTLAVPLLRAGRALSHENTLRATLGPLIDHCCGPSALRRVELVLDHDSEPGLTMRLGRQLEATIDELLELGALRAQLAALREVESHLWPLDLPMPDIVNQTMRSQLDLQLDLFFRLDERRARGGRDHEAVVVELQHCSREVERLWEALEGRGGVPLLERALGE